MRDCSTLGICQDRPIRCIGCVPGVRSGQVAALGAVLPELPGVLCAAGGQHVPEQAARGGDAGRDRALSAKSWAGRGLGVRGPTPDETPLSAAEVEHGLKGGLV